MEDCGPDGAQAADRQGATEIGATRQRWGSLGDARADEERERLAVRLLTEWPAPGVLVAVQNTFTRNRGRPASASRNGFSVVPGGSHDRHPGLYLGYVVEDRCGFVDRELYLPRSMFRSPALRAAAGLPDGLEYSTQPQLVMRMLTRALAAGAQAEWLVAGPGFVQHWPLHTLTELRGLGLLVELTAEELEEEILDGLGEPVEGQVVNGHVWTVTPRPACRSEARALVQRYRLADRSDRTAFLCRSAEPTGLDTVLRLVEARRVANDGFAALRRLSRDLDGPGPAGRSSGMPAGIPAQAGAIAEPMSTEPRSTEPIMAEPLRTDPWTSWYARVTRAMAMQAAARPPVAERLG